MKVYAATHIGLVRSVNQDSFYAPKPGERFAVVADGMGGHLAGEVASRMAVEEFTRWLKCAPRAGEDVLTHAVAEANLRVYYAAKADPRKAGMGTTLTAIWFDDENAYMAHVGDSRAYLLRNGVLMQMSRDHSIVGEMLERGEITPEEAQVHPQRHYITRALGTARSVEPDIMRMSRSAGDVWLLCSDGMSNHVSAKEMSAILSGELPWEERIRSLIDLALRRGGTDNITVLAACGMEVAQ